MHAHKSLWRELARVKKAAGHLLILLDYDGTLTPIVRTPKQAKLKPAVRRLLKRLTRIDCLTVAVVSGRSLKDIKRMVKLPNLIYAGNHGFELKGSAIHFIHPKAKTARPIINCVAKALELPLSRIPGAWLEHKGLTLSIHYRMVKPAHRQSVHALVSGVTRRWRKRKKIKLTDGKCVLEVRPDAAWGKGSAVKWLIGKLSRGQHQMAPKPIYLGDDKTDESAFDVVNRAGGISIFVGGRRATKAAFRLRSQPAVLSFLRRLANPRLTHSAKRS